MNYMDTGILPIYFGFTTSERDYLKEMKRLKIANPPDFISLGKDATCHSFERINSSALTILVALRHDTRRSLAQLHALIVHEVVHAVQITMDYIGEHSAGNELEAYTVQALCQYCFEILEKERA